MTFALVFHRFSLSRRAWLAPQFLCAGAALLLAGSIFAQTPAKSEKVSRILTVTDSVQLVGSKISGGWREYAVNGSWRRVEFVLDREAASVTFGDGETGRRLPGVTRYVYTGIGGKDAKAGDAPAVYSETHTFAGATPGIRDKANQSSPVPADVATRVRELGGDIKLMQQAADIKRISELGSALDAAGSRAAEDRFFGDRPGGAPRRSGGGWSRPGAEAGGDGRAGDGTAKAPGHDDGPKDTVVRHADGSTTTTTYHHDGQGNRGSDSQDRDASGNVTGGFSYADNSHSGNRTTTSYTRNPGTDTTTSRIHEDYGDGRPSRDRVEVLIHGRRVRAPSETPYRGRGGFDEAWMDKSLPWFMDAVYVEWRRKSDLVKSGGMISQPGRGEDSSPGVRESPRVGASAVTNCGDTGTNPCARFESGEADARESMNSLTQPPRDVPTGGPLGGTGGLPGGGGGPSPVPNPQTKP
jgi:hypothetical protein